MNRVFILTLVVPISLFAQDAPNLPPREMNDGMLELQVGNPYPRVISRLFSRYPRFQPSDVQPCERSEHDAWERKMQAIAVPKGTGSNLQPIRTL